MVKIGNLVSSLEVNGKKVQNPDWWYTLHKLKKDAKTKELIAKHSNINCRCSYTVNNAHRESNKMFDACDCFVRIPKDNETAWWDKSTIKQHTIILFK